MRYFIFYQNLDSRIQCIIAIISKNRCSLSGWKVRCLLTFEVNKAHREKKKLRLWPKIVELALGLLLLSHLLLGNI